jgi:hypothetical protein
MQRKAEGLLLHALQLLQAPVALRVDSRCGSTISTGFVDCLAPTLESHVFVAASVLL